MVLQEYHRLQTRQRLCSIYCEQGLAWAMSPVGQFEGCLEEEAEKACLEGHLQKAMLDEFEITMSNIFHRR